MNEPSDRQRLLLIALFAAWVIAFGYAFFTFAETAPSGDGFTRGMNRITSYLGWQGIAGMIAIALVSIGRGWPKGSAVRRMSGVPLLLAILHVAAILGIILWARASN
ncbi:MAG: hypothetical protein HKP37_12650 [Boseongicola sp.]|nr:hypothetical protein [Boseongicola sp.]NNL19581.1 hypothetical protein [Boseongicola sp.]